MFSNEKDNYNMLYGAYKKLKSYYYYNKNFLFMREKIAGFEFDKDEMEKSLNHLAMVLKNPQKHRAELNAWMDSIDMYVLPKTLSLDRVYDERFITSSLHSKSVTKVNFFIDMPIELHLIETVWTLFVAKMAYDNDVTKECSFGNVIDNNVLFDKSVDGLKEAIRFQKNKLFKIYFPQYCDWKNGAIEAVDQHKKDKSTVLVSLDIKSFFYSIHWKFDMLDDLISDSRLSQIESITRILRCLYEKYTNKLRNVREISHSKRENVLPIGLFSSMLIANIYMSKYDTRINEMEKVLYYGRYVDDILILMNVTNTDFNADDKGVEKILVNDNSILSKINSDDYCLFGYTDLKIQREKLKIVYFECKKSEGLISQIKKAKLVPSQMNIIPNNDIHLVDFEEAAYVLHNFTAKTKIRDIEQLEIDRLNLSFHMADLVRASRYKSAHMASADEKIQRQKEKDKVIKFFTGSNAIEYNSNWLNALYFIMLSTSSNRREWNSLEENIRTAIKNLTINHIEDIYKNKSGWTKSKMKKDLQHMFDVCIATALAINPRFSKKEKREIIDLCYMIRDANLFNHYLVTFPLLNYSDNIENDISLSDLTLENLRKEYFDINKSRKMNLSPRFIYFDELFQYFFIRSIILGTSSMVSETIIEQIRNKFISVNDIDPLWAKPLSISITDEKVQTDGYNLKRIALYNKKRDLSKLRIAVANVKLDIDACCMGLNGTPVIRNRLDFIMFLENAYKSGKDKVDYLVFPEYYLPIAWMHDVLSFSRKTGITVITGMQYIYKGQIAQNNIGVFARIKSGKYNSSCVIVREKNDYAPLEKQLLATEGYKVSDRDTPIYTSFEDGQVRFGLFLCYEFTDICARALFKEKADIIFIPENNSDTTYFSNIVETMTRDIHAFMVQSNTSIYGDSRISGPFSRDQRNVVQIKGGDDDSIIIGTINLSAIITDRIKKRKEMEDELNRIFLMNASERAKKKYELKGSKGLKISKVSARTIY